MMEPVSPVMPGSTEIEIVIGKGQPQYLPLPAVYLNTAELPMITRWRLTDEERALVAAGADVVLTQLTFGRPYAPIHMQITPQDEMPVLVEGLPNGQ
jgi:hypothetical protein